ncbi:MAG: Flp family type IVb pilin [Brevefilum sp.]|nr:Flp family type IVb pilin [Brevefilum sp.]
MARIMLLQLLAFFEDAGIVDEKAQTLVEYGLILLLIAIAVVGAVTAFGGQVRDLYQSVVDQWP